MFLISLPFVTPRIRQDGIAYYAVARSLVIDHNLQFRGDWKPGEALPLLQARDTDGRIVTTHVTSTGHLPIHSAIGASLLWMPFVAATHIIVLAADHFGAHIPADGFSAPYVFAVVAASCLFAFLGLWISFRLARRYTDERWAFLATVAVWLASSLAAYIYVDPSWSHPHSVFAVAFFLWYWNRTRESRTAVQWAVLGLLAGLMVDVYFPNAALLLVLAAESATRYAARDRGRSFFTAAFREYTWFACGAFLAFLPTFAVRYVLFGNPFAAGAYGAQPWHWTSPALLAVLFSPSQGLFTTTPVLLPAAIGHFLLPRRDAVLGRGLIAAFCALAYLVAAYPYWNLGPAFGNRYFISLTPAFILGLACALARMASLRTDPRTFARRAWIVVSLLVVWNLGLVFQFATGLMPDEGRVYWQEILYNEFRVVPGNAARALLARFAFHAGHAEDAADRSPSGS